MRWLNKAAGALNQTKSWAGHDVTSVVIVSRGAHPICNRVLAAVGMKMNGNLTVKWV